MISSHDLIKHYNTRNGLVVALDNVSVEVKQGDFVAVTGRSGAGKSTLLGVMGGLLRPSSGEVILDGDSFWRLDERARARIRAQRIGFVFQNASVIGSLTVLENVMLPTIFATESNGEDLARAMELIELIGIGDRAHAYPEQLSGGEKRRVAIASALMNDPPLLLADEPTGDLDAETEAEVMDIFLNLNRQGKTIVMITHNNQLASYAGRILEMNAGVLTERQREPKP